MACQSIAGLALNDNYNLELTPQVFPVLVGGGGYLTKFNIGRLRPEAQPPTLLYTILSEKVSFLYTF